MRVAVYREIQDCRRITVEEVEEDPHRVGRGCTGIPRTSQLEERPAPGVQRIKTQVTIGEWPIQETWNL